MTGRVDIRRAAEHAKLLGEFTRADLADSLGVSPLECGRWLKRLTEERDLLSRQGRVYRWDPADEREVPPPAAFAGQDCRIVARKLGDFTCAKLAEALGISASAAALKIEKLIQWEIIRDSGKTEYRERGKRPVIYAEVPIEPDEAAKRRKLPPIEVEMRASGMLREPPPRPTQAGTGASTGSKLVIRHKELRELVDAIHDAGGSVQKTKNHLKATLPGVKATITLPATPGSSRIPKTRAMLRNFGLDV